MQTVPLAAGDRGLVALGDNLAFLQSLPDGCVDLVYIDPPFNTGGARTHTRLRSTRSEAAGSVGFGGRRYVHTAGETLRYDDSFDDYLAFLEPRLAEARRVMAEHATLYVHLDYREVHEVKLLLDRLFGRDCFLNEVIWAYDYGGRPRDRWPAKHDNILVYVRAPGRHRFNRDEIERVPYLAPGLVTPEKRARGKLPTDTWWHTIVPTSGRERTGYPTQKPLGILRRIVQASSYPDDVVLDFFAGSGTTGAACLELHRRFMLVDTNPAALAVMARRFRDETGIRWLGYSPSDPSETS